MLDVAVHGAARTARDHAVAVLSFGVTPTTDPAAHDEKAPPGRAGLSLEVQVGARENLRSLEDTQAPPLISRHPAPCVSLHQSWGNYAAPTGLAGPPVWPEPIQKHTYGGDKNSGEVSG